MFDLIPDDSAAVFISDDSAAARIACDVLFITLNHDGIAVYVEVGVYNRRTHACGTRRSTSARIMTSPRLLHYLRAASDESPAGTERPEVEISYPHRAWLHP